MNTVVLALLFTRGISLSQWESAGILDREIRPYLAYGKFLKSVYFFTYGVNEDKKYHQKFPEHIHIISRPWWCPVNLYAIIMPLVHRKVFQKITIIKTNQMDGSLAGVVARALFDMKLVVRAGYEWLQYLENTHSAWWKRFYAEMVEKIAYRNADHIIITSSGGKDFIVKRFQIIEKKITIVPNWIDTELFVPDGTQEDPKRIIFVGRLESVRNVHLLIDAMVGLDAHLVVIGSGSLRKELETYGILKKVSVTWMGTIPQKQLPIELQKSALYVLPSSSEGNPKSLLEAMACGLPCIGTNVSGIREIIQDGENGVLCGTDVHAIHGALQRLLGDSVLRQTLGDRARKTIVDKYSFENIIAQELNHSLL